jgi:hypothetical protein
MDMSNDFFAKRLAAIEEARARRLPAVEPEETAQTRVHQLNRVIHSSDGGRTRTRTLDPLIKSRWRSLSADFDLLRGSAILWRYIAIFCNSRSHCSTLLFGKFRFSLLTLRLPEQRPIPWRSKD